MGYLLRLADLLSFLAFVSAPRSLSLPPHFLSVIETTMAGPEGCTSWRWAVDVKVVTVVGPTTPHPLLPGSHRPRSLHFTVAYGLQLTHSRCSSSSSSLWSKVLRRVPETRFSDSDELWFWIDESVVILIFPLFVRADPFGLIIEGIHPHCFDSYGFRFWSKEVVGSDGGVQC